MKKFIFKLLEAVGELGDNTNIQCRIITNDRLEIVISIFYKGDSRSLVYVFDSDDIGDDDLENRLLELLPARMKYFLERVDREIKINNVRAGL